MATWFHYRVLYSEAYQIGYDKALNISNELLPGLIKYKQNVVYSQNGPQTPFTWRSQDTVLLPCTVTSSS